MVKRPIVYEYVNTLRELFSYLRVHVARDNLHIFLLFYVLYHSSLFARISRLYHNNLWWMLNFQHNTILCSSIVCLYASKYNGRFSENFEIDSFEKHTLSQSLTVRFSTWFAQWRRARFIHVFNRVLLAGLLPLNLTLKWVSGKAQSSVFQSILKDIIRIFLEIVKNYTISPLCSNIFFDFCYRFHETTTEFYFYETCNNVSDCVLRNMKHSISFMPCTLVLTKQFANRCFSTSVPLRINWKIPPEDAETSRAHLNANSIHSALTTAAGAKRREITHRLYIVRDINTEYELLKSNYRKLSRLRFPKYKNHRKLLVSNLKNIYPCLYRYISHLEISPFNVMHFASSVGTI